MRNGLFAVPSVSVVGDLEGIAISAKVFDRRAGNPPSPQMEHRPDFEFSVDSRTRCKSAYVTSARSLGKGAVRYRAVQESLLNES